MTLFDTVTGGVNNTAKGNWSTVDGGFGNTASGQFSIAAGGNTNTASGSYSFVAGGNGNTASGANSFAAGFKANASMDGSIVFATGNVNPWPAFATNRFEIFATGGFCFDGNETPGSDFVCFSAFGGQLISTSAGSPSPGANLTTGGVWTNASDRNAKRDFSAVNPQTVLQRVIALPVSQWSYKAEDPKVRHLGPMAQDFYAAFKLGKDDKHIGTVDEEGVALAAIQGLNQKLEEELKKRDSEIASLRAQLQNAQIQNNKDAEIAGLKADVEQLRQLSQQLLQRVAEVEQQAHEPRLQAAK